jgi:two-component system nitrogen regulation sensor histidine kinase NtrY
LPAAALLVWVLRTPRSRALHSVAALFILSGVLLGFVAHNQLGGPGQRGGSPQADRVEDVSLALSKRFEELLASGEEVLQETLDLLADADPPELQEGLARIRRGRNITALAVYDADGRPQAWVGVHRGRMPEAIRRAEMPYAFAGGPLFKYLYFTAHDSLGGGSVVAAALLQANLPAGLEGGGFASRFRRDTGVPIRILPPDRRAGPVVWDLNWGENPLLVVSLEDIEPRDLWAPRIRFWVRALTLIVLLAWGFLAVGGRSLPGHRTAAPASLLLAAVLLPASGLWPGHQLTSPAQFLLFPVGGTLGQVLGVLAALALLCGLFPPGRLTRVGPVLSAGMVAVAFPLLGILFRHAPSPALLSAGPGGWVPYQAALALALALVAYLALELGRGPTPRPRAGWLITTGAALSLVLAFVGGLVARNGPGLTPFFLALWGSAAFVSALGVEGLGRTRRVTTWVLAALLGASAALPAAWGSQIKAHMVEAEGRLEALGSAPHPYTHYRLLGMAEAADSLDGVISSPVEFLFEIWAQTGRQGDPIPMWLTLWSPGDLPREDLNMGVLGGRPPEAYNFLEVAREGGIPLVRHLGLADARYLLLVPLDGGRILSAVIPPEGSFSSSSPLGPLIAASRQPGMGPPFRVPVEAREGGGGDEETRWVRTAEGWRGERLLSFPGGWYSARQVIQLPGPLHMLARGTLALLLDVLLILVFWVIGRIVARGREVQLEEALRILGSFRARVTLALFGFFLLSVAIFGTLAFQTLSGAAEKTASALAERLVEDGASLYYDVSRSMELLSQKVGADLLEYRDGEWRGGSPAELVDLGLYEGWIPEPLFRALEDRSEVSGTLRSSLGEWEYVMAYRRLPDGDILATPVPVEAGATALRRQEVADLLGFAIVLGAALSLGLSLLVGRTLTRPIETLRTASEKVGAGNLGVRLPENRRDEFGEVFGAFNRMVLRIRLARRDLLRTTRRTQAIVEEAATGVVALDSNGRVTLVNPRAESLLNEKIPVGEPLPGRDGWAGELVGWVDLYFRDGIREANTELQLGSRRIRVRARRVSEEGPLGGAVLSLEDVTDELRTERILAWGEMAQQVAHEVKNPLTPIKLSVQHLQRAWDDQQSGFGEILGRNVEVILREIEHLAAISRSFSRFGAPQAAGAVPLEPVSIHSVSEEVMNLYRGGTGALTFQSMVTTDLPLVQARDSELREVLVNLLENSRAAIPEEGTVVIEAGVVTDGVELRVRDSGTGISPKLIPRVFEPHFSTRSTGTGLGLAIVRRLVESWGGTVSAESVEGEGTVVRMTIPSWGALDRGGEEDAWS